MELLLLQGAKESMLSYMRNQNISDEYMDRHGRLLDRILKQMNEMGWQTFDDVITWIMKQPYTDGYRSTMCTRVRNLEWFCKKGYFHGNGAIQAALKERCPSCGELDLSFWQDHLEELTSKMKSLGYCDDYIFGLSEVARRIAVLSRTIPWNSYTDVLNWYQQQGLKTGPMKNILARLGILEAFHMRNELPGNMKSSVLINHYGAYHKINPEYKALVDYAEGQYILQSLAESTIMRNRSGAASFLWFMESNGAPELRAITSVHVYQYYDSPAKKSNGKGLTPRIRKFLETCIPYDEEARRVMLLLPLAPSGRELIQYVNEDESQAFLSALTDMTNGLSYLARAIGTILYYTGLRRADIANIMIDNIDLRKKELHLVQRKTKVPLTLPLPIVVGNAIYDYCTKERPITDSDYLFVGGNAPHRKIGWSTIDYLLGTIYDAAGIRKNGGDRRGFHIFRHRMATKMLENNIQPIVISQTLGHSAPESLDAYLYADKVHLKECALSLELFPVSEEVYAHV